jgi:type VI secretion system protein VasG
MDDFKKIIECLNPYCSRGLNDAMLLCQSLSHEEVLPEHWMFQLMNQGEGDIHILAERFGWDKESMMQMLLKWLYQHPRNAGCLTGISAEMKTLLSRACMEATIQNTHQIRSVHLLMALVEHPSLLHCNSLWSLLSLGKKHLAQLIALLNEFSDERPMEQHKERLLMQSIPRSVVQK